MDEEQVLEQADGGIIQHGKILNLRCFLISLCRYLRYDSSMVKFLN